MPPPDVERAIAALMTLTILLFVVANGRPRRQRVWGRRLAIAAFTLAVVLALIATANWYGSFPR